MNRWDNLKTVYRKRESYLITLLGGLAIGYVLFYFTNYDAIVGNWGVLYANVEVVLQVLLSFFFGLNLSLLWYKLNYVGQLNAQDSGATTIGTVLGVIVSGCPSCGITLASYIGLASVFSVFPLAGMELKILGLLLLMYSSDDLIRKLHSCQVKPAADTQDP